MSQRNLLILTFHFPPSAASGAFRMLGFARHLPRHGWRTSVVAPPWMPWEPQDPELLKQVSPETSIYHVPYLKNRLLRKFAPAFGWFPWAWNGCRMAIREQRPEILLTSGPPHQIHWLGCALKRWYGLPWVADFRDPWCPFGRLDRGDDRGSRWIARQEAAVVAAADAVIANAPGAREVFRRNHPCHAHKFVTLPNGFDREKFAALRESSRSQHDQRTAIRVVHAGAIYLGRDPLPFLDVVKTLSNGADAIPLDVHFFGPPPESDLDLNAAVQARGLADRVVIEGQVPYAQALREMVEADVLLLMDSPGRTVGVPAKVYEYIGAGRPILALGEPEGDLASVLRESGIPYRIAPPHDSAAIASAMAALSTEIRANPSRRGDPDRFSRESITGRLASLLEECVAVGRKSRSKSIDGQASVRSGEMLT